MKKCKLSLGRGISILLALLYISTLYAQTEDVYVPDSISNDSIPNDRDANYQLEIPYYQYKSPEAAAFRRYGEQSVNEFTGDPNISVPLYTLSYKDIEIPITLTYNGSGIKVDQEASWVGLGWNLMIGGCINYVASGEVDPRYLYATASEWDDFAQHGNGDISTFTDNLVISNGGQLSVNQPIKNDLQHGYGDKDYFSVNILGKSFSFVYERVSNKYKILGDAHGIYKIEDEYNCSYTNIDNARWKITDGNGFQYFFIPAERTYGSSGFQNIYTSAWYLSLIVTPEGSAVEFNYSTTYTVPFQPSMHEQNDFVIHTTPIAVGPNGGTVPYSGQNYNSGQTVSTNYVETRYLTSIVTASETITFTLGSRTDLVNSRKLQKITVKSNISNNTIREFVFNYSYFTASTVGGDLLSNSYGAFSYTDALAQRLKLTSVDECGGTNILSTCFEYNEDFNLPLKTSAARDFWGYYNHKENLVSGRLTLLPTPRDLLNHSDTYMNDAVIQYEGANRYCSKTHIHTAVLKKITYPTKGYTRFVFEPHRFVSSDKYPDTGFFTGNHSHVSLYDTGVNQTPAPPNHQQIDLSGNAIGTVTVTFSGTLSNLYSNNAKVQIIPMNPNIGTTHTYDLSLASQDQIAYSSSFTRTLSLYLEANSYMVTVYCPKIGSSYSVSTTVDVNVIPTNSSVPVNTGGGLRIRRIENYDSNNVLLDSTAYIYTGTDGNCSGKLLCPMKHYEKKEIVSIIANYGQSGTAGISQFTILRLKPSSFAMTTFSAMLCGSSVGYSSVTQKRYNAQGGLLSTRISNFSTSLPKIYSDRYYYGAGNNGNLTSQIVKDANGNTIRETQNTYDNTVQNFGHILLMEDRVIYDDYAIYNASDFPRYRFWHFPLKYIWNRLARTITTTYDGQKTLSVTTDYDYNTVNHLVKSMTENSSNTSVNYLTEYKYPSDFSSVYPYSLMSDSVYFMQYPVIEQSFSAVENGTTKLIHSRKDSYSKHTGYYRDCVFHNGAILPSSSSYALNGGPLQLRLSYDYNNLCDRTKISKDGEVTSYLWAYNNMYPVAEIRGASYSDLTSWGLSTSISSLATKTSTSEVSVLLSTIRSALENRPAVMTSYTYDPSVGITGITAPNGTVTTYTYDALGRLSNVKNHGGNTVQQHSYNYK